MEEFKIAFDALCESIAKCSASGVNGTKVEELKTLAEEAKKKLPSTEE